MFLMFQRNTMQRRALKTEIHEMYYVDFYNDCQDCKKKMSSSKEQAACVLYRIIVEFNESGN